MNMKMNNNIQKVFNQNIKRIAAKTKTAHTNEQALFHLIIEHPYYVEGVINLRKTAGLPTEGVLDQRQAYLWEQNNEISRQKLEVGIKDLLSQFNYPAIYKTTLFNFTYDGIICPARVSYLLAEVDDNDDDSEQWKEELKHYANQPKINAAIIHTTASREINKYLIDPDALYIRVTRTAGIRDVQEAFSTLKGMKAEASPFIVATPQKVAIFIWQLSKNNELTDKEITKLVKEKFTVTFFTYSKVEIYRSRFKQALGRLKPLSKDYRKKLQSLPTIF